MRELGLLLGLLVVVVGCTHIPAQGAEARHAMQPTPAPSASTHPPPDISPSMAASVSEPAEGAREWTNVECSSNAYAQDVWGSLQIAGIALAGTSGFTAVEWKTDEGQNRAKFAALISGAVGLAATFINNNLKSRAADYCPKAPPKKE